MDKLIVIGGGGHASVLINAFRDAKIEIFGVVDPKLKVGTKLACDSVVIGNDSVIEHYPPHSIRLINGIGSTGARKLKNIRLDVYNHWRGKNIEFIGIIHPTVIKSVDVIIDSSSQIMAGAILQPGVIIHENAIINTGAIIDHDCLISSHVHIAPGVVLSGNVHIGSGTHIGTGARVIQNIEIGENVVVGAGVTVLSDVPDGTIIRSEKNNVWHRGSGK